MQNAFMHRSLSPISKDLFDYWSSKGGSISVPRRTEIDIIGEVPRLARNIFLAERLGPSLYRYRVIGSAIADLAGRDPSGRIIDAALLPETFHEHIEALDFVVRTRQPAIVRGKPKSISDGNALVEAIGVPLRGDQGDEVAFVLGALSTLSASGPAIIKGGRRGTTVFQLFTVAALKPDGSVEITGHDDPA
jgi:hypothetical protein